MGTCCSNDTDEERNHLVDSDIRSDRSSDKQIKKLLLLGPGSSGKTTFFKQLKIIHHQNGFSKKDRRDYQAQIENQIIEQMQKLITRGREFVEDSPHRFSHLQVDPLSLSVRLSVHSNHHQTAYSQRKIAMITR